MLPAIDRQKARSQSRRDLIAWRYLYLSDYLIFELISERTAGNNSFLRWFTLRNACAVPPTKRRCW
jgi:hypothetical protein